MDYPAIIARVREVARQALPPDAIVLVVSRGDDALLDLGGARGWHFPRAPDGAYGGSHPADGAEAIVLLELARSQGAQFLLIPATSFWWLEQYEGLAAYLEHRGPPVVADQWCHVYDLRGSGAACEDAPLTEWNQLRRSLLRYASDERRAEQVDQLIAQAVRLRLATSRAGTVFDAYQSHGLHVLPVHYYSPVPDTRALPDRLWSGAQTDLVGIDWNDAVQLDLMRHAFPRFREEYESFPTGPTPSSPHAFFLNNGMFEGRDALVYHCMIRHFRPRRVVEVGSGFSARLAAQAALLNGDVQLTCIEPYPSPALRTGFPGLAHLIAQDVQAVPLAEFEQLEANDVLFIDSTHVVKVGSDVNHLFFEVLPRLRRDVIVHLHDVFLPLEYPRPWITQKHLFWNEQYLLRAFLTFNRAFEVLLSNVYLALRHPDVVRATFPTADPLAGASFWMRRAT